MTQIFQVLALVTLLVFIRTLARSTCPKDYDPRQPGHTAGLVIFAVLLNVVIIGIFYLAGCFDLILP